MARLDVTGMQEAIRELQRLGEGVSGIADEMLQAAGQVVAQGWQYSAAKHGHIRTGAMYDSIKAGKPKTIGGVRSIIVSPTGTDGKDRKKPVRNQEKAYVLHFGRTNMTGSGWVNKAEETSAGPAADAMEGVFYRFIDGQSAASSTASWQQQNGTPGTATFYQG